VERRRYVELVESVREKGAEVLIFSSMHESGQRGSSRTRVIASLSLTDILELNQLTGIAALLTFPLDVEVVEEEEREAREEEKRRAEDDTL
jgi:protein pelota